MKGQLILKNVFGYYELYRNGEWYLGDVLSELYVDPGFYEIVTRGFSIGMGWVYTDRTTTITLRLGAVEIAFGTRTQGGYQLLQVFALPDSSTPIIEDVMDGYHLPCAWSGAYAGKFKVHTGLYSTRKILGFNKYSPAVNFWVYAGQKTKVRL